MTTAQTLPRILTLSFTATTAMWVFSYMTLLFAGPSSGEVLFVLAGLSLVLAGMVNAMHGGCGVQSIWIGGISALLNLMLLGSLIGGSGNEEMLLRGTLWFGVLLLGSMGLTFTGGRIGQKLKSCNQAFDWKYGFFVTLHCWYF